MFLLLFVVLLIQFFIYWIFEPLAFFLEYVFEIRLLPNLEQLLLSMLLIPVVLISGMTFHASKNLLHTYFFD